MNPLSLLTKGRTIKGWKDRTAYKLPKGPSLPNFSTTKPSGPPTSSHQEQEPKISQPALFDSPEQQPPAPAPARAVTLAPVPSASQSTAQSAAQTPDKPDAPAGGSIAAPVRKPGKKAAQPPASAVGIASYDSSTSASHPASIAGQKSWHRFFGKLFGLLRRWAASRKTSPFQGRTVQTELALDKVTVMRNDLSEEDLEVVPVEKKEKPPQQLAQHDQCQTISTNQ